MPFDFPVATVLENNPIEIPKYEPAPPSKPEINVEDLEAWLEKQPAEGRYNYANRTSCLLAQYLTAKGHRVVRVGTNFYSSSTLRQTHLPLWADLVASGGTWTFGHALKRLRTYQDLGPHRLESWRR